MNSTRRIDPNKKIQRQRTEQEMRLALNHFRLISAKEGIPEATDVDDARIILNDAIEELLERRQMLEEMRGFVSTWYTKLARR